MKSSRQTVSGLPSYLQGRIYFIAISFLLSWPLTQEESVGQDQLGTGRNLRHVTPLQNEILLAPSALQTSQ